jgi:gamma-glutamyl:cysteine ligase YbdK (ATP-grasp superfamily)
MGRIFDPLSVGYDWEMAVLRRTGENIGGREAEALADDLRRRLPWCIPGTDLELIESRIGFSTSFADLLTMSERFDAVLRATLKEKGWDLLRLGTRPAEREPVGAHIHVGTVWGWAAATRIQNAMARYAPPLAALMVNSPVYRGRTGEYKSYRVASFAEWCSMPQSIVAPAFSQPIWGTDVCSKLTNGSTVELRIGDGVSSTRLMCELTVLVGGLMHHVVERELDREVSEDDYRAAMLNRWRAAKHGLGAFLLWEGREVPAQTVLTAMVDMAQDGMQLLGASADDMRIVRTMLKKRQTQADFQLAVFAREGCDAHRYTRTMANIQRDPAAFEKYLSMAPTLPLIEPEDCARDLLESIGVETPYTVLVRGTPLAPAHLDALLERIIREGLVVVRRSEMGIRLYTRTELASGGRGPGGPRRPRERRLVA